MTRIREFNLPDLGEGLTEGEILKWFVKVGDVVTQNQPIVEVETAKAAVEIPAKWAGRVQQIFHGEGATVEVGTPIIAIDTDPDAGPLPDAGGGPAGMPGGDADLPAPSAAALASVEVAPAEGAVEPGVVGGPAPGGRTPVLVGYGPRTGAAKRRARKDTASAGGPTAPAAARTPAGQTPPDRTPARQAAAPAAAPTAQAAPAVAVPAAQVGPAPAAQVAPAPAAPVGPARGGGPVLAKPPVRKLARDLGVDLFTISGTGPQGSITRADVQAAVAQGGTRQDGATPGDVAAPAPAGAVAARFGPDREQRIPVKGVRKLTAANVAASAFTAPHVTEFLTVDVTRGVKALDRLRSHPDWQDARISPLLLVAKAVLLALKRYPMVNSTWADSEIVVKEYVNLGIAAATERGLIVPNIKDAGRLSLRELADAMTSLVRTAKAGRTSPEDMAGGTFTITNVGVFGVDTGTPILPPGEAAILAFGAVREMPWVHKGKVRVRKVTTLGLSFDHRIIDGELGSLFLRDIGAFLTDPESTLLAWG